MTSMRTGFAIAGPDDADRMVAFHNSYYRANRTAGQWRWEYFGRDPAAAVPVYAEIDGRVVATQGMIPYDLSIGGVKIATGKSENTLALPETRGSGLMSDLYEFAVERCRERGMQAIWGFTTSERAFQRFGFDVIPVAGHFSRLGLNPAAAVAGRMRGPGTVYRRIGSSGKQVARRFGHRSRPLRVRGTARLHALATSTALHSRNEVMVALRDDQLRIACDEEYMRWRWVDNPNGHFRFLSLQDGARHLAWTSILLAAGRCVLSDFVAVDKDSAVQMLARLNREFRFRVGAFDAFGNLAASDDPCVAALTEAGFVPRTPTNLVVRYLAADCPPTLSDISNWSFTNAWSEGFDG